MNNYDVVLHAASISSRILTAPSSKWIDIGLCA